MTGLTHPPAQIIATKLIDLAIFTDPEVAAAWPVFIASMPDGAGIEDNAAAVYDTQGIKDGRLMDGTLTFFHGIQIRIRGRSYTVGWDKAVAVETAFETIDQATTVLVGGSGGTSYKLANLSQVTPILSLGLEEGTQRRHLFTINFLTTLMEV